jgi:hypothetical protein
MTVVAEVRDGVKLVADGIENIRTIYSAMNDGKEYIDQLHPDVKKDLAAVCVEMRKTANAVATASAIITHFRFTTAGHAKDLEPARFNEHLLESKSDVQDIEDQLNALRGRCGIIREHAQKLDIRARRGGLRSLFRLIGVDSEEREEQLGNALTRIYDDEMQFHHNVYGMRQTLESALEAVGSDLGPRGTMDPKNVPKAAATLGEYADIFNELESNANYAAFQLQQLITGLEAELGAQAR